MEIKKLVWSLRSKIDNDTATEEEINLYLQLTTYKFYNENK